MSQTVTFLGHFTGTKVGVTGLTVTVDVKSVKKSDGTIASVATGASATEVTSGRGLYFYRATGLDLETYVYTVVFITSSSSVDQKEIPAASWMTEADVLEIGGTTQSAGHDVASDAASAATNAANSYSVLGTGGATLIANLFATVTEGSETFIKAWRLMRSALVGKISGAATTTVVFRDATDSKDRITATVDSSGNRSAVTTDGT